MSPASTANLLFLAIANNKENSSSLRWGRFNSNYALSIIRTSKERNLSLKSCNPNVAAACINSEENDEHTGSLP